MPLRPRNKKRKGCEDKEHVIELDVLHKQLKTELHAYSKEGTGMLLRPPRRQARILQMRVHQRQRLATELNKEREARLQQMRDRLFAETDKERGQITADEG